MDLRRHTSAPALGCSENGWVPSGTRRSGGHPPNVWARADTDIRAYFAGLVGGPILNSQAQVIAVAVGILEEGQNLNLAVPIKFVQKLLNGDVTAGDLPTLFSRVDDLFQAYASFEFIMKKLARVLAVALQVVGQFRM